MRIEGVGGDDVGTRLKIERMDFADEFRARQCQKVVVALQTGGEMSKNVSAEVLLCQVFPLEHGAHGTVKNEDAPFEQSPSGGGEKKIFQGMRNSRGQCPVF